MCGRFPTPGKRELDDKVRRQIDVSIDLGPNYNTAPTDLAPVTISKHPTKIEYMRWGFDYLQEIKGKSTKAVRQFINARAETLDETKTFKGLIADHRCLVYSKGFYEWSRKGGGDSKQPFLFRAKTDITVYAGLWQYRQILKTKEVEACFIIITCEPNDTVGAFHDRMPVILSEEQQRIWLAGGVPEEDLLSILVPYPDDHMFCYPVTKSVNSVRNNSADFLVPVSEDSTLF